MFKITIFRFDSFLHTVNSCDGPVNVILPDGQKENINRQYTKQYELQKQFNSNHNCLKLSLEVPAVSDYFKVVNYAIGS